jgi:hypothetical protein
MGNTESTQQYTDQQQYIQQLQYQMQQTRNDLERMKLEQMNNPQLFNQRQYMSALTNKNKERKYTIEQTIETNNRKLGKLNELLLKHKHVMTQEQFNRVIEMKKTLELSNNLLLEQLSEVTEFKKRMNNKMQALNVNTQQPQGFNMGTQSLDYNSRILERRDQLDTVNKLQTHYKNDEERELMEFELEQKRKRQEFLDRQRARRMEYQTKLKELEQNNVNALNLFGLNKNYTLAQLKSSYKKLAIKTHPDRPGGSNQKFQLVTKCYMSLLEKHKLRESDKTFMDLRKGSQNYMTQQTQNTVTPINAKLDKDKFDLKLFNKLYEQNKLWDPTDQGYDDWMKDTKADVPEETPLFSKKFNLNVFNSTFESYKGRNMGTDIVEYKTPQAMVSSNTGFTEIDNTKDIGDFTKAVDSSEGIGYTDLKTAYTYKGAFIDPNTVEYKTYNSVDELKRDRSNISYTMTPEQIREAEIQKMQDIEAEERRQQRIRERDIMISNNYSKVHQSILGYSPSNDY